MTLDLRSPAYSLSTVPSSEESQSLARTALLASDDHREGLPAARERRDPEFAGR